MEKMWTNIFCPEKTASPERRLWLPFFLPEQLDPNDHCWYCSLAGQTSALDAAVKWEVNLFPNEGRCGVWTVAMLLMGGDVPRCARGSYCCSKCRWSQSNNRGTCRPRWAGRIILMDVENFTVSLRHLLATAFSGNTSLLLWLSFLYLIDSCGGLWIRILNVLWYFL